LLKQSLMDEIKYANKDMDETKKALAESGEIKSAAEGDLAVTQKALAEDIAALGSLHQDCMTKAQDFEAETTSRGEELKALAMAKKAVKEGADLLKDDSVKHLMSWEAILSMSVVPFLVRDLPIDILVPSSDSKRTAPTRPEASSCLRQ